MPMSPRLLRPRQASGFTPRLLTGLSAWYDATVSSSVTIATGVSQWNDLSGNNRHVVQAVGNNQPAYTGTINGKAALVFDGTNDRLTTSGNVQVVGTDATWTAFAVFSGSTGTLLNQDDSSSPRPPQFIRFWTGASPTKTLRIFAQNSAGTLTGAISQGVVADNVPCIATSRQSLTDSDIWVNGGSSGTLALIPNSTQFNKAFDVGSIGGGSYYNGRIGEVIFYGRALTTAERQTVERYLGRKWGVTVA